ncbi:MAG: hypothetical protein AB8C02_11495 [Halioglobus sp.]
MSKTLNSPAAKHALFLIASAFLVAACSHPLEITGEGDILSASGERDCLLEDFQGAQSNCTENLVLGGYGETYFAVARPGWEFSGWEGYCTDTDTDTNECSFSATAGQVFSFWGVTVPALVATFAPEEVPDFVIANGLEWYQPSLFGNLSWNDINTACPAGVCAGTLNGQDMTGWTWASVPDLDALFNSYIGFAALPTFSYTQAGSPWAPAFFADGWAPTIVNSSAGFISISGWSRNASAGNFALQAFLKDETNATAFDIVSNSGTADRNVSRASLGAFFYRELLPSVLIQNL